jgi:hypothetical protein
VPVVTIALTVAGTVDEFDEDGFKTGLASELGVAPEVISLTVTAASVNVVATIAATEGENGNVLTNLQMLASSADVQASLGAVLGVTLESVAAPEVETVTVLAPSPPPPAVPSPSPPPPENLDDEEGGAALTSSEEDGGMIAGVVVAVVLVVLLAGGGAFYFLVLKKKKPATEAPKPIEVKVDDKEDKEAVSATDHNETL